MTRSYAVVWRENGAHAAGKLEVRPRFLRLQGGRASLRIPYGQIADVRMARSSERIEGRPSVVLERRKGAPISVSCVAQPGAIYELADRLAALPI